MVTMENFNLNSNEKDSMGMTFTCELFPPLKVKLYTSRKVSNEKESTKDMRFEHLCYIYNFNPQTIVLLSFATPPRIICKSNSHIKKNIKKNSQSCSIYIHSDLREII